MKKYIKPEIRIDILDIKDIICTSGGGVSENAETLKISIAGREGLNYGSQSVSIYD